MNFLLYKKRRGRNKDWIAFICTDTSLSEEEIIQIYGRRRQIEVFFKSLMINSLHKHFNVMDKQLEGFIIDFYLGLPEYMQTALMKVA